jgi:sugar phosphate permease
LVCLAVFEVSFFGVSSFKSFFLKILNPLYHENILLGSHYAIISCLIAGLVLLMTFTASKGAPQEAAGAAVAAAIAIIPYVFSRAVAELAGSRAEEQGDEIIPGE